MISKLSIDQKTLITIYNMFWAAVIIYGCVGIGMTIYLRFVLGREIKNKLTQIRLDLDAQSRAIENLNHVLDDYEVVKFLAEILKDGEAHEQTKRRNDDSQRRGKVYRIHPEGQQRAKQQLHDNRG